MSSSTLFRTDPDVVVRNIASLYQRNEESFNQDVERIKDWMKTQPHLPEIMSDQIIRNFLIRSKFSIEKTKQKIDRYYTIRSQVPDFFEEMNPQCDTIQNFMKSAYWVPLPETVEEIYRVFLFKIHDRELFEKTDPMHAFRYIYNLAELRIVEDTAFGEISVVDCEGATLPYFLKMTPVFLTKSFAIYRNVFATPLKNIYYINVPPFAITLIGVVKKLLKPKLAERVHVCEDASILTEHFSSKILPKDYGGEGKSLEELGALVQQTFLQHKDHFEFLDKFKVDENLRPNKLENDEILGFHGNFKQLGFD